LSDDLTILGGAKEKLHVAEKHLCDDEELIASWRLKLGARFVDSDFAE
jgi:hypothetical protein